MKDNKNLISKIALFIIFIIGTGLIYIGLNGKSLFIFFGAFAIFIAMMVIYGEKVRERKESSITETKSAINKEDNPSRLSFLFLLIIILIWVPNLYRLNLMIGIILFLATCMAILFVLFAWCMVRIAKLFQEKEGIPWISYLAGRGVSEIVLFTNATKKYKKDIVPLLFQAKKYGILLIVSVAIFIAFLIIAINFF